MPSPRRNNRLVRFISLLAQDLGSLWVATIISIPVTLSGWVLIEPGTYDSMTVRVVVTAMQLLLFGLSLFVKPIQRHAATFLHLSLATTSLWAWWLSWANDNMGLYLSLFSASCCLS